MLRVGLTGGLAGGKSFAAAEFARLCCAVLEADKLGHQILANDVNTRAEVAAEFGTGVLGPGGAIDRKALAAGIPEAVPLEGQRSGDSRQEPTGEASLGTDRKLISMGITSMA